MVQTLTYKKVGALELQLDVTAPPSANKAPILLWFHGGGLLYVLESKMEAIFLWYTNSSKARAVETEAFRRTW